MKCEKFSSMLDAYLDGELSPEDMRKLTEHASACESCNSQIKAAKLIRDTLNGMDDGLAVPLEAQAAWRSAVKREARRRTVNRRIRAFTVIAAAAVILFGSVTLIGNRQSSKMDLHLATTKAAATKAAAPMAVGESAEAASGAIPIMESETAMLASDGVSAMKESAENIGYDYTCRKKYAVEDVQSAGEIVAQLAGEYDGTTTCELSAADEAIYRVELPIENMGDFLSSVNVIGDVRDSEGQEWTIDPAIIYIHIQKS